MGQSIYWKPVIETADVLSDELKMILRDHFGGMDAFPLKLDWKAKAYLQGLADGRVKDAGVVIKAIDKHGEIELELR